MKEEETTMQTDKKQTQKTQRNQETNNKYGKCYKSAEKDE